MTRFVTFWTGGPLSRYEHLSLRSFARRGHTVELYTYEPSLELPEGVTARDARDVLPLAGFAERLIAERAFAMLADMIRYRILASGPVGLTWVDTDVVLLAEDLPPAETLCAYESSDWVNNAVLRTPPSSALARRLLDEVNELNAEEALQQPWGTYGPRLLTRLVGELSLEGVPLPTPALYPIGFAEAWRMFDPGSVGWCLQATERAYAVHLWNEMIRQAGLRGCAPPRGSFLRQLFQTNGVDVSGTRLPVARVHAWAVETDPLNAPQRRSGASGSGGAMRRLARRLRRLAGARGAEGHRQRPLLGSE